MKTARRLALLALAVAAPLSAFAHPGHEGHDLTWDFSGGFAHPFTGWDHLLAMIAVGLWAAQLGGRARWLVPAAFLAAMTAGAAFGRAGFAFTGLEQSIAASVFVLGLLVATSARLPLAVAMTLTGLFAAFHGLAHGAEMPATSGALGYGIGFVAATAALHALGLGLGLVSLRTAGATRTKYAGYAIAACGLALLAG